MGAEARHRCGAPATVGRASCWAVHPPQRWARRARARCPSQGAGGHDGFDHGVGHPLLFPCNVKAPNYQNNKVFNDLGNYSEWPKVAGAVIEAHKPPAEIIMNIRILATY
jgi:hypothetical protein